MKARCRGGNGGRLAAIRGCRGQDIPMWR
jgi:hypothetical protein